MTGTLTEVLRRAAVPTARAIRWSPLVGVVSVLLAVALLARLGDAPADTLLVLAAAAIASTLVAALHDPAASLLAAVPTSELARRLLRLALLAGPALAAWWLLTVVAPDSGQTRSVGPLLALTTAGVAVAVLGPRSHGVLVGAAVPVVWFVAGQVAGSDGVVAEVLGSWRTQPWAVAAVAGLLVVAGRRR